MCRRLMTLLCLIAALSGTPLRQAEAASDLVRSLAELGSGHLIEAIDGGVGDDSGETVLNAGCDADPALAGISLAAAGWIAPPLLPDRSPRSRGDQDPADRNSPLPAWSGRRHAWLQCFLF